MDFQLLKTAKEFYEGIVDNAISLEDNEWIVLHTSGLTMENIMEIEIIRYMEYLIAADKRIDRYEVDVFKFITGYGGETIDSIKADIENSDVMSYSFQSEPPLGLRALVEGTNDFVIQNPDKENLIATLLTKYLFTYFTIGHCVISADDTVSYSEKRALKAFLRTLIQYIRSESYVARNEILDKFEREVIEGEELL